MDIDELREKSGRVSSNSKIVALLYRLMRDKIPTGELERLVIDIENCDDEFIFTNGWLAEYAKCLEERLTIESGLSIEIDHVL